MSLRDKSIFILSSMLLDLTNHNTYINQVIKMNINHPIKFPPDAYFYFHLFIFSKTYELHENTLTSILKKLTHKC